MQSEPFFVAFKQLFSEDACADVVAALRQDPLVWDSLQSPGFFSVVSRYAGSHLELWNPASIALLALEKNLELQHLRSFPLLPLEPELRQQAARAYEDLLQLQKPPATLAEAGLLALALRERRRLTDTWQGLPNELQLKKGGEPGISCQVWRTPLACLFAMAPDPIDLLKALAPTTAVDSEGEIKILLHAVLSSPMTVENQAAMVFPLVANLGPAEQMAWFEVIRKLGRSELAARLSEKLLKHKTVRPVSKSFQDAPGDSPASPPISTLQSGDEMAKVFQDILTFRQVAAFQQLSGNPAQAQTLLSQSIEALKKLQAGMLVEKAEAARRAGNPAEEINALENALELTPASTEISQMLAVACLEEGKYPQAAAALPDFTQDPDVLITRAAISSRLGDRLAAQDYARRAVQARKAAPKSGWSHPELAIKSLLDLSLTKESAAEIEEILKECPVDPLTLEILSRTYEQSGDMDRAVQAGQLAVLLQPQNPRLRKSFAGILESSAAWDQALKERATILELTPTATQPDLLAYANCAIQTGLGGLAEMTCKGLLETNPEDGLAHAYLGLALQQKGEHDLAMEHFTQATLLSPEKALPWLSLARALEASGETYRAFETLRTAVLSSPQSAEIQYVLGEACLANGSPTEALPALRKAASLDPRSPQYSIRLGEILRELGHLSESKQILERARGYNPIHPDLAYEHSKTLEALGEKQAAIPALLVKLDTQPTSVEPYLTFARLVSETRPGEKWSLTHPKTKSRDFGDEMNAQTALQKALELDPGNLEARVLLAENYESCAKYSAALQAFQELADHKDLESSMGYRVKLGLGRTALALDQKDIALAALQEAAAELPGDLSVQQSLAEACFSANLFQEALQAARNALQTAPQDQDNLAWFACLAFHLGAISEATLVLEQAIELNPLAFELCLGLIQIQIANNHPVPAQELLAQLEASLPQDPQINRQAAYAWAALGDLSKASQAIIRSIQLSTIPTASLWFDLARLQGQYGDTETALNSIQEAINLDAAQPAYYCFQAEALIHLGRERAALACLDQALQVGENADSSLDPSGDELAQQNDLALPRVSTPAFKPIRSDPASIHLQLSRLYRSLGELPAALTHAEQALSLKPAFLEGVVNAAEIAFVLLEYDVMRKMLQTWTHPEELRSIPEVDRPFATRLLVMEAELDLEMGDLGAAETNIEKACEWSPKDPRVLAVKARICGLKGDLSGGEQVLELAIGLLNGKKDGTDISASYPFYPDTFVDRPSLNQTRPECFDSYPTLTIAEAGFSLFQWDGSIALFDQAVRNAPMEPRTHLCLARAMARCAETERTCRDLHVLLHAPGEDKLSDSAYQTFEHEIMAANRLSNSLEVARWHKRGQAAFHPNQQCARLLSELPANPEDSAALITVCRQVGDLQAAGEVARLYPESVEVLLQQALALKETNPAEGFFCARTLVGFQPNHPLHQACMAVLASEAHEESIAFEALQNALQIWPNEAGWHLLAADLSEDCGDFKQAASHLEKAYALEPDNPTYALRLGKAHLACKNFSKADEYLECVTRLSPNDVDGWLALAEAQRQAGDLAKAIASAEKAISIRPDQVRPLVISGEIALQDGQVDLAYQHAQTALRIDSSEGHALLLLIRCLVLQGHASDALTALDLALPSVGDPLPLQMERVSLVRQLRGPQATLESLKSLAEEYPTDPAVLALLAEELANAGQRESAEKAAQAALQAEPNQPYLHLLVGRLQRNAGQLDQAIYHLSEAVHQNPDEIEAYLELGKAYQDRRDHAQALNIYRQAIQVRPKDPRSYYQAGLALKESKDYPGSELMLRHAADLSPEDVNIRRQLGAIIAINLVHHTQEASL
ncbi:MAG TPA: tetratricopeptide repeat protein [Anaerolineaceae bacterium]|nr:tetratricopeptide repeat protein [Anaerolineaceae bacterium]